MVVGVTAKPAAADRLELDLVSCDGQADPLARGAGLRRLQLADVRQQVLLRRAFEGAPAHDHAAANGHACEARFGAGEDCWSGLVYRVNGRRDSSCPGDAPSWRVRGGYPVSGEPGAREDETVQALFRHLRDTCGTGPLWRPRQEDGAALRHHLVEMHTPLVEHCARNLAGTGEPLEDLVQEGCVGLIKAVDRFDPDQGVRFSTYAYHLISGEIRHYLRDLGKLIREPGWHSELRQRLARTHDQLVQKLGRAPSPDEIAEVLDLSAESVAAVLNRQHALVVESLDNPLDGDGGEDGAAPWSSVLGLAPSWEARIEDRLMLKAALPQLRALERAAVTWFYFHDLTKTEIARRLDISINYAAYLVKRGLKNLRRIIEQGEAGTSGAAVAGSYTKVPPQYRKNVAGYPEFRNWLHEDVQRASRYQSRLGLLRVLGGRQRESGLYFDAVSAPQALFEASSRWSRGFQPVTQISRRPHPVWPGVHSYALSSETDRKGRRAAERWVEACHLEVGLPPGRVADEGPAFLCVVSVMAQ